MRRGAPAAPGALCRALSGARGAAGHGAGFALDPRQRLGVPPGWDRHCQGSYRAAPGPRSGSERSSLLRDSGPEGPGRSPAVPWARLPHGSKQTWWSPVPARGLRAAEPCLNCSSLQEDFKGDPKSQGRLR